MEMKKYKLGELTLNITDGEHGSVKQEKNGSYYLLNNNNITEEGIVINATDKKISETDYRKIHKRTNLEKNDLVIATCGTLGKTHVIKDEIINYEFSRSVGIIKCNSVKLLPLYLHYYFKNPVCQTRIKNISKGGVQKHFYISDMNDFDLNIPEINEQRKIISILSSLDDKIALNNRINAKLEQMAKRLYDYWFVQFDFPGADGKPYKSNGGKMVWNEELKREIPEGWEVKSVNDISVSYRGVGYTSDDEKSETDENVVLILRGNNISNNHIVFDSNTVYLDKTFVSPDQEIHKFDLVMTMSSGSKEHVGKSAMFLYDSPHSYGAFCNKITPNKDCQYFLENYLHSEYFKKYIQVTCSGTGINNLTNEHFDKAKFAFPSDEVLKAFNDKMKAIYDKQGILEQENLKLTSMRDKLLPLLMNGQVVVE